MLLETKKINQIWKQSYKLLFAIIGISILIWNLIGGYFDNYTINIVYKGDYNDYTINFFSTFTGWSNIMLLVWFLYAGICHQLENKRKLLSYPVALTVGLYITITFIIYNCLLVPTQGFPSDPRNVITTIFDHIINPLVFVIYVICFFENKQPVKSTVLLKKYLAKIIGFLLIYCFYAIVRGELRRAAGDRYTYFDPHAGGELANTWYPYFFLNLHDPTFGIPGVAWFFIIVAVIIGLLVGSLYLYNFLSNKMVTSKYYPKLQSQ